MGCESRLNSGKLTEHRAHWLVVMAHSSVFTPCQWVSSWLIRTVIDVISTNFLECSSTSAINSLDPGHSHPYRSGEKTEPRALAAQRSHDFGLEMV